jgi:hypothetical protein
VAVEKNRAKTPRPRIRVAAAGWQCVGGGSVGRGVSPASSYAAWLLARALGVDQVGPLQQSSSVGVMLC